MNYEAVVDVLRSLEEEGVRYVVFGGAALNLHGLPRFTEDLDLFVDPSKENIEALKRSLARVFSDPHIDEITADDLIGDYPAVQYVPPEGTFHIDILTRLGTAFRFGDLEAVRLTIGDVTASVATPRTLFMMKKDTVRAKDRMDAEVLRDRYGFGEE